MSYLLGWIRLQNGYYLPIQSDDGKVTFLKQVSTSVHSSNTEKRTLGSTTPMFRPQTETGLDANLEGMKLSALLEDKLSLGPPAANDKAATTNGKIAIKGEEDNVRPAIHMDAMAFGMGCCCLQITFQAQDVDESRFMYDQLAVVAPIMMALTASTPFLKGRIADTDCRWGIISESVDDRTPTERGKYKEKLTQEELAGKGQRRIYKSRYDCISTYIYQGITQDGNNTMGNRVLNMYNDIPVPIDEDSYKLLRESGVDPALSQHVAHLFIRDPLVIFDGFNELDDQTQTEHFESIQSTNW